MGIELWILFLAALCYLGTLFFIAYAADKEILPKKLVEHPAIYALSLGCLLYTSPSPRDLSTSRMPSSA